MDKYSDLLNAYDRRTIVGIDWSHENHQPGSVLSWYTVSMQKNTHTHRVILLLFFSTIVTVLFHTNFVVCAKCKSRATKNKQHNQNPKVKSTRFRKRHIRNGKKHGCK